MKATHVLSVLLGDWKRTTQAVLRTTTIGLTERDLKSVLKQAITGNLQRCVDARYLIKAACFDGEADRRHCKSVRSLLVFTVSVCSALAAASALTVPAVVSMKGPSPLLSLRQHLHLLRALVTSASCLSHPKSHDVSNAAFRAMAASRGSARHRRETLVIWRRRVNATTTTTTTTNAVDSHASPTSLRLVGEC